jgi:hypothetical protein
MTADDSEMPRKPEMGPNIVFQGSRNGGAALAVAAP